MSRMVIRKVLHVDWDVIAGVIAAIVAMFMSFLGLASQPVVLGIILLLCALLLLRDLRGEARMYRLERALDLIRRHGFEVARAVSPPEVVLYGPKQMRQAFREFATEARGEVVWHNACCRMFHRLDIFENTLRLLIRNPNVRAVQIICDERERSPWVNELAPKLVHCDPDGKFRDPVFGRIGNEISFLMAEVDEDERVEALMSVLEQPFAAHNQEPSVPRYLLRVQHHSPLIGEMLEIARHSMSSFKPHGVAAEILRDTHARPTGAEHDDSRHPA